MKTIIAIDPGNEQSAVVVLTHDGVIMEYLKWPNENVRNFLRTYLDHDHATLVIEQVACMGMAVGAEVFETVFWSGRFAQLWEQRGGTFGRMKRHEVKMHLCGSMRAKDSNIRQALIDKLGKPGTKKAPGPTYGISGDMWQALALAVTYRETRLQTEN